LSRSLPNSRAVTERSPAWSPDAKSIAYLSDEGGEYRLHVRPADGKEPAKQFKLTGAGWHEGLEWSPDSKKIAYQDNSWTLYWITLEDGAVKKVATEPRFSMGPRSSRPA